MLELIDGQIRRRAAAKVDEVRFAPADKRFRGVQAQFLEDRVDVSLDLGGILVRIDLEIAEVTALPAKRDVDVEAQRGCWLLVVGCWRAVHGRKGFGQKLRFPERKRRVV